MSPAAAWRQPQRLPTRLTLPATQHPEERRATEVQSSRGRVVTFGSVEGDVVECSRPASARSPFKRSRAVTTSSDGGVLALLEEVCLEKEEERKEVEKPVLDVADDQEAEAKAILEAELFSASGQEPLEGHQYPGSSPASSHDSLIFSVTSCPATAAAAAAAAAATGGVTLDLAQVLDVDDSPRSPSAVSPKIAGGPSATTTLKLTLPLGSTTAGIRECGIHSARESSKSPSPWQEPAIGPASSRGAPGRSRFGNGLGRIDEDTTHKAFGDALHADTHAARKAMTPSVSGLLRRKQSAQLRTEEASSSVVARSSVASRTRLDELSSRTGSAGSPRGTMLGTGGKPVVGKSPRSGVDGCVGRGAATDCIVGTSPRQFAGPAVAAPRRSKLAAALTSAERPRSAAQAGERLVPHSSPRSQQGGLGRRLTQESSSKPVVGIDAMAPTKSSAPSAPRVVPSATSPTKRSPPLLDPPPPPPPPPPPRRGSVASSSGVAPTSSGVDAHRNGPVALKKAAKALAAAAAAANGVSSSVAPSAVQGPRASPPTTPGRPASAVAARGIPQARIQQQQHQQQQHQQQQHQQQQQAASTASPPSRPKSLLQQHQQQPQPQQLQRGSQLRLLGIAGAPVGAVASSAGDDEFSRGLGLPPSVCVGRSRSAAALGVRVVQAPLPTKAASPPPQLKLPLRRFVEKEDSDRPLSAPRRIRPASSSSSCRGLPAPAPTGLPPPPVLHGAPGGKAPVQSFSVGALRPSAGLPARPRSSNMREVRRASCRSAAS